MDICTIIVYAYSILLVVSEDSFKPKIKKDQEIKKITLQLFIPVQLTKSWQIHFMSRCVQNNSA